MTTVAVEDTWDRLGTIARLLHTAAVEVWDRADQQPPDSPLHDLGLGVYLAQGQATALLPADYTITEPAEPADSGAEGPLQLLVAAEELTRHLQPDLAGVSDIVIDLCDLIREARSLGY